VYQYKLRLSAKLIPNVWRLLSWLASAVVSVNWSSVVFAKLQKTSMNGLHKTG